MQHLRTLVSQTYFRESKLVGPQFSDVMIIEMVLLRMKALGDVYTSASWWRPVGVVGEFRASISFSVDVTAGSAICFLIQFLRFLNPTNTLTQKFL